MEHLCVINYNWFQAHGTFSPVFAACTVNFLLYFLLKVKLGVPSQGRDKNGATK